MIRNTMFALSLLALSGASAFAASPTKVVATHHTTRTVAEGDAAPTTEKPKKEKKAKKEKAPKAEKDAAPKAEMAPATK